MSREGGGTMKRQWSAWLARAIPSPAVAVLVTLSLPCGPSLATGASAPRGVGPLAIIAGWTIALVDLQGRVVARVRPRARSLISTTRATAVALPIVSASRSRLYYLDGDRQIRVLTLNGTTAAVATVPGNSHAHVAFAVSPDDRQMAVSVLDYAARPAHLTLYVQDLRTGRRHALLVSTQRYEWPIGWRSGALVLAVAASAYTAFGAPNPYEAWNGYHVVNAATGQRLATLCPGGAVTGPVVRVGTPCWRQEAWSVQSWTGGTRFTAHAPAGVSVLAPDGHQMAWRSALDDALFLLGPQDHRRRLAVRGYLGGWLDATHLLVGGVTGVGTGLCIVDVRSGRITPTAAQGRFVGVLPSDLGPY